VNTPVRTLHSWGSPVERAVPGVAGPGEDQRKEVAVGPERTSPLRADGCFGVVARPTVDAVAVDAVDAVAVDAVDAVAVDAVDAVAVDAVDAVAVDAVAVAVDSRLADSSTGDCLYRPNVLPRSTKYFMVS
jgi:hypothetical protein